MFYLWRRSYAQNWEVLTLKNCYSFKPPSYASTAYVVASFGLVSFLLFRKNLGNLREVFGQIVYGPPWQKITRTPMVNRCKKMTFCDKQCYLLPLIILSTSSLLVIFKFIEYPPGKRCLKRQVMSARTNYFTDIGTNCHIQLCVVSGLEETLPDCLQHVVLYSVSFFIPTSFSFSVFYFVRHFRLSHLKQVLLRHSPSIIYCDPYHKINSLTSLNLKKAGMASRNIVNVKTIHVVWTCRF